MVIFPHSNGYAVKDDTFAAAWRYLCDRYSATNPLVLPRLPNRDHITVMDKNHQQLSVEYLCKAIVPNGYKGTSQATQPFLRANSHIVRSTAHKVLNHLGNRVAGVEILHPLPTVVPSVVEALFEGDADPNAKSILDIPADLVELDPLPAAALAASATPSAVSVNVIDFVKTVHNAAYYRTYRGVRLPPGTPIYGWDDRLAEYFWPNPSTGLAAVTIHLAPILGTAMTLATAVSAGHTWTPHEEAVAQALANRIFEWGGVPQKAPTVTASNIRKVFETAITGKMVSGTLMNSGWTKVAAFATHHLPPTDQHVIWDSRVSTSVVRRLDAILGKVPTLPAYAKAIGLVNVGRGGTRPLTAGTLKNRWPNGYKSWAAQFAGSAFVRSVRDALNAGVVATRRMGSWTVRDVEMVLFMDGY